MDLYDLYDIYVPIYTDRKPDTARNYRWNYRKHLELVRGIDVQKLVPSQLQSVLARMSGSSQTTIRSVYGDLVLVLHRAYEDRLIDRDLSTMLVKPKGKRVETRRALTPEERRAVLEVGESKRKYYPYLFMILCGCRPSEAFALQTQDIDVERRLVHVRGTKSAFSDRFVPCPEYLSELALKSTSGLITTSERGLEVSKEMQRRFWHSFWLDCHRFLGGGIYRHGAAEPFPFGRDLTAYCLRHEYCTQLARGGIDFRVAQKLMGHSSPEMTLQVYTNLDQHDIDADAILSVLVGGRDR